MLVCFIKLYKLKKIVKGRVYRKRYYHSANLSNIPLSVVSSVSITRGCVSNKS